MKVALICILCVVAYIGIALAFYAVLNWFDPEIRLKDNNKLIAGLWPMSIPLNIVVFAVAGVEMLMDMIRAYQDRRRANDGQHS